MVRTAAKYHLEKVGGIQGKDVIKRAVIINNSEMRREDVYVERVAIIRIVMLVLPVKIMSVCLIAEQ